MLDILESLYRIFYFTLAFSTNYNLYTTIIILKTFLK